LLPKQSFRTIGVKASSKHIGCPSLKLDVWVQIPLMTGSNTAIDRSPVISVDTNADQVLMRVYVLGGTLLLVH
jgi:hypothetical protein